MKIKKRGSRNESEGGNVSDLSGGRIVGHRGNGAAAMKDKFKEEALKVIATLYVAMRREGWEEGPTIDEASNLACDWFYNNFGHDREAASVEFRKAIGLGE